MESAAAGIRPPRSALTVARDLETLLAMLVLRRLPTRVVLALLVAILAPSATAVAVTWHVAHEHAHEHEHEPADRPERHVETAQPHECRSHDSGDHRAGLFPDSAGGSRSSTDELRHLQLSTRTSGLDARVVPSSPHGWPCGVAEGASEPPELSTLCRLQI